MQREGEVVFAINGEKVALPSTAVADLSVTLNDYLRRSTKHKGTKLACGEGGCGACAVDLSRIDPVTLKEVHMSVNSCLRPLASMDGWSVTTTEGIGNSTKGYHPIQERVAGLHGSQCGFCTPGMVMTLYSSLKSKPQLTMNELENRFDGNICRCTGYRPILDAAKSFAVDSDIEDLVCRKVKSAPCDHSKDPAFPEFLKNHDYSKSLKLADGKTQWIRPNNLKEALTILKDANPQGIKVIVGNTGSGIYKEPLPSLVLDLQHLPELTQVNVDSEGLHLGAAASITTLVETLQAATKDSTAVTFVPLTKHVLKIANVHVRNAGSIGGNLVLAKIKGFLSDLSTILLAAGAKVTLVSLEGRKVETLEEFLATKELPAGWLLETVTIPFPPEGTHFDSFKAALRPQNSHAYVNAGFNVVLKGGIIQECVFAFGGVHDHEHPGAHAIRAPQTENFVKGKPLSHEMVVQSLDTLKKELCVSGTHKLPYRQSLITGFLYKFLVELAQTQGIQVNPKMLTAFTDLTQRPTSSGHQKFSFPETHAPVALPIPKLGVELQASGEALFSDDIPDRKGTLYAAVVPSTEARAELVNIDATEALKSAGVVRVFTAKDVPNNDCGALGFPLPVLADKDVRFHGQPVAVVVAETLNQARAAVKLVKVTYDRKGKNPVVNIQQAVAEKTEYGTPLHKEVKSGDVAAALAKGPHTLQGVVNLGEQKHFYMEPQNVYVHPDEGGSVVIYAANQWPDGMQSTIAKALKKPTHKVRTISRRAGGAFGGKFSYTVWVACLAAVPAVVLDAPVRLVLDRNTDMALVGGREEVLAKYEVAYDDEGRISAFKVENIMNAGWTLDAPLFTTEVLPGATSQIYNFPNYFVTCDVVRSNLPFRTAVRGPLEIEASYIVETVLEHVAHATNLPPQVVRERNMYTGKEEKLVLPDGRTLEPYTVPALLEHVKKTSNYQAKVDEVNAFNNANRWKKRGVSITPVRYGVRQSPQAALVNIYGDGSVIITHGGCEMGQGLHTKTAQAASYELSQVLNKPVPLEHFKMADADNQVIPNAWFTGGSTTSEGTAEAVRRCAKILVERLKGALAVLQDKLKKENKDPDTIDWPTLCGFAKNIANLSAQDMNFTIPGTGAAYMNYGVAASVVEVDVITGETQIQSVDLVYDCGKSLNPAVDIGQCEGAFMMGVGFYLREESWITEQGELVANGTWEYKPPCAKDVPLKFNVEFLENAEFEKGVLSSKSSGEPPLVLATSVVMAVRSAIASARREIGLDSFFELATPLTPDAIVAACGDQQPHFTL